MIISWALIEGIHHQYHHQWSTDWGYSSSSVRPWLRRFIIISGALIEGILHHQHHHQWSTDWGDWSSASVGLWLRGLIIIIIISGTLLEGLIIIIIRRALIEGIHHHQKSTDWAHSSSVRPSLGGFFISGALTEGVHHQWGPDWGDFVSSMSVDLTEIKSAQEGGLIEWYSLSSVRSWKRGSNDEPKFRRGLC